MTVTIGQLATILIGLFGFVLTFLNILDKVMTFKKNASTPFQEMANRVTLLETRMSNIELTQKMEIERNNEQDKTNEVLIRSTLALIDFEMQYCITEKKSVSVDLQKAHSDLREYLSSK